MTGLDTGFATERTPSAWRRVGPGARGRARIRVWRWGRSDVTRNGPRGWIEMAGREDALPGALGHLPLEGRFVAVWMGRPMQARYSSRSDYEAWKAWISPAAEAPLFRAASPLPPLEAPPPPARRRPRPPGELKRDSLREGREAKLRRQVAERVAAGQTLNDAFTSLYVGPQLRRRLVRQNPAWAARLGHGW